MKTIAMAVVSALTIAPALAQWDGPYRNDRPEAPRYVTPQRDYTPQREYAPQRDQYARVIESKPVYAASREECFNPRTGAFEERRDDRTRVGKGAAIGAIAGGVLGHQVDHGEGTAAGAILGGILGHQIERRENRNEDLDLSRCRVAAYDSGVTAYDVRYRFRGQEYVTRMDRDPGNRLLVGQDVNEDGTPLS